MNVICIFLGCPALAVPEHGSISTKETYYGVKVRYTCDAGYDLINGVVKTCLFGGKWSLGSPRCRGLYST